MVTTAIPSGRPFPRKSCHIWLHRNRLVTPLPPQRHWLPDGHARSLLTAWSWAPAQLRGQCLWSSCQPSHPVAPGPGPMAKAWSPPPVFSIEFFFAFGGLFFVAVVVQQFSIIILWQKTSLLCLGRATELFTVCVGKGEANGLLSAVQEAQPRPVAGCLRLARSLPLLCSVTLHLCFAFFFISTQA